MRDLLWLLRLMLSEHISVSVIAYREEGDEYVTAGWFWDARAYIPKWPHGLNLIDEAVEFGSPLRALRTLAIQLRRMRES